MAKQSIKQKIPFKLLAVFGLLAAIILIGGWLFYKSQRAATTRHIQSDLNTIALMKSEEITTWRRERYGNAYLLSSSRNFVEFVRKWFANPSDQVMKNNVSGRLNAFKVFNSYETVILVDSENKFRMNDDPTIKVDKLGAQTRSYIDSAAKSREIIFSDFYYCPDCRHDHLDIFAPLFDGKAYVGCLIFRVNPHVFLYPLIQSWPTDSRSGETLLLHLHRKDNVVHILNELRFEKATEAKKQLPLTDTLLVEIMASLEKTGMVAGHDYRGIPVVASIKHIADSPWYMVVKMDQDEIYAPLFRQERIAGAMILLLLSVSGLLLGLLWQGERRGYYKKQYQMEQERQALVQHYDYLTKYANDIIFLLDDDRKVREVNDRGLEAYGYSREEMIGLDAGQIRADDQRPAFKAQMKELAAKGSLLYETEHRRKDGTTFPVEISARTIEIEGKKYLQGIVRDISERKQYELQIQERNEELESANQTLATAEDELMHSHEELESNYAELEAANQELVASEEELKEYLAKLSQSEIKYRNLIESAYDAIFIADAETGIIIEANQQAGKLLDMPLDRIKGMHQSQLHPPEEAARYREIFRQHLESGRAITEDLYVCRRDGARIPVDISASVIELDGRRLNQGVFRDISEQKRAEEALLKNEERFKQVAESAEEWIWEVNTDGLYTYSSPAVEKILGYKPEEIIGKKYFYDFFPPEIKEDYKKAAFEVFARKETFRGFINSNIDKNGKALILETSGRPVLDDKGNIVGYRGADTNVTERKRAEEENIRLLELLDNASNSVTIHDMKGRFLYANKITYEMLGYTREEFMAMDLSKVDAPESAELIASRMNKLVANGEAEFDVNHLKKDGTKIPMMVSAKMSKWNGQEVFLSIAVNITERKKAEAALAKTRALLTESQEMAKIGGWEFDVETMKQKWTEETFRISGNRYNQRRTQSARGD